jgi:hypothetical protein
MITSNMKRHMNFVYYSSRVAAIVAGDAHNDIYNYSIYTITGPAETHYSKLNTIWNLSGI